MDRSSRTWNGSIRLLDDERSSAVKLETGVGRLCRLVVFGLDPMALMAFEHRMAVGGGSEGRS
jgi:hypothetical protein